MDVCLILREYVLLCDGICWYGWVNVGIFYMCGYVWVYVFMCVYEYLCICEYMCKYGYV